MNNPPPPPYQQYQQQGTSLGYSPPVGYPHEENQNPPPVGITNHNQYAPSGASQPQSWQYQPNGQMPVGYEPPSNQYQMKNNNSIGNNHNFQQSITIGQSQTYQQPLWQTQVYSVSQQPIVSQIYQQPIEPMTQYHQPTGQTQVYSVSQQPLLAQMQPINNVVVVGSVYCQNMPVTLNLSEKIDCFSGDDFFISDQTGREWFSMDAKTFSIRNKRTLQDINKVPIMTLEKVIFSIGTKWHCYRGNSNHKNDLMFSVEPKIFTLNPYINIYLNDGDRDPDFKVKGTFFARDFQFFDRRGGKNVEIARCTKTRPWASAQAFIKQAIYNADEYFLSINPGVDAAFVTSICVLLDEIYHDEKRKNNYRYMRW